MTKFFCLFIFSRAARIRSFRLKREYIGNKFPICISDYLLNMCSQLFVMVLNQFAAGRHNVRDCQDYQGPRL